MRPAIFYRIAALLILLFALGHTLGFRQSDPKWGVDGLLGSMRSIQFQIGAFTRNYWDFFTGFGLFVTVFLIFAAVVAWWLGGLPPNLSSSARVLGWALTICFLVVTFLSWRYFFLLPLLFSLVISACLLAASWMSRSAPM